MLGSFLNRCVVEEQHSVNRVDCNASVTVCEYRLQSVNYRCCAVYLHIVGWHCFGNRYVPTAKHSAFGNFRVGQVYRCAILQRLVLVQLVVEIHC